MDKSFLLLFFKKEVLSFFGHAEGVLLARQKETKKLLPIGG